MNFLRASGILLHPTSLPGEYGIGDLGSSAFGFVDFLRDSRQAYWQILPLGPTGWGDSPYASYSAFAGNTLLVAPEKLLEANLLEESPPSIGTDDRVDYGAVYESKTAMLSTAFSRWQDAGDEEFNTFERDNEYWLGDYALYRAIKLSEGQRPWYEWPEPLKFRHDRTIADARDRLQREVLAEKFYQFLFFKQWSAVREYANASGVRIVGDIPIFVALDSADVWRHREQFKLKDDGSPTVVSGVPPDYFSKTGQLWGNPIYDWDAMKADGFSWWTERVRQTLSMVDIVRIDHFRGFEAAWEVPGGDPTAEHGEWVKAPGRELFEAIGDVPIWVEDLGFMTDEVHRLRDDFGFPGMRILQFAFGGDARNEALPHNYVRNSIVYTGTHDNDTIVGWWKAQPEDSHTRQHCRDYLGTDGSEINWELIRSAWASVADTSVAPLQDLLGLDNSARMNLPASTDGNWQWRFREGDLTDDIAGRLKALTEIYGRAS